MKKLVLTTVAALTLLSATAHAETDKEKEVKGLSRIMFFVSECLEYDNSDDIAHWWGTSVSPSSLGYLKTLEIMNKQQVQIEQLEIKKEIADHKATTKEWCEKNKELSLETLAQINKVVSKHELNKKFESTPLEIPSVETYKYMHDLSANMKRQVDAARAQLNTCFPNDEFVGSVDCLAAEKNVITQLKRTASWMDSNPTPTCLLDLSKDWRAGIKMQIDGIEMQSKEGTKLMFDGLARMKKSTPSAEVVRQKCSEG